VQLVLYPIFGNSRDEISPCSLLSSDKEIRKKILLLPRKGSPIADFCLSGWFCFVFFVFEGINA
jgi:hypothetical protein